MLDKLYPKQPEEKIERLALLYIDREIVDLEECLLSWKRDIASIVYDAKAKQQREVQDRKGKQVEAFTICKSKLIPELSKTIGYLDWIEGVKTVFEKVQGYTSDLLISDALKKSLKIKSHSTDTFPCKTTLEILDVMKKNYVLDRNLFLHLFRSIGDLKDPVNKYQAQVNCEQVALLLNRIKNQELVDDGREVG